MSDFSDDWLALRAPADGAARADALVAGLAGLGLPADGVLAVTDLGCGTGANLRHLAPRLAAQGFARQRWRCIDHDAALLTRLPARTADWARGCGLGCEAVGPALRVGAAGWSADVRTAQRDLGDLDRLKLPAGGLVTASALLDLVSAAWLDALLTRCVGAGAALLCVLSYDGRCELVPGRADDALVIDLVNRHQRTDKGFGVALGPMAAATAVERCRALGYAVRTASSDWDIGPDAPELQRALLAGWRDAAAAMAGPGLPAVRLDGWLDARLAAVAAGASRLRVGHVDLLALPPKTIEVRAQ
jgi:SAM-dependent methyltransferase